MLTTTQQLEEKEKALLAAELEVSQGHAAYFGKFFRKKVDKSIGSWNENEVAGFVVFSQ